jgi:hypothetical protein
MTQDQTHKKAITKTRKFASFQGEKPQSTKSNKQAQVAKAPPKAEQMELQ